MKLRALLAIALAGIALALFGPSSSAVAYPASVCSTISMSTSNPNAGDAIRVTGAGFVPGKAVELILRSQADSSKTYTLKTVTASATGSFSTAVTLPDGTINGGHYDLTAASGFETTGTCPADPSQDLTIGAVTAVVTPVGTNSGGGGTAFTGVNVLLMIVAAGALLGTGVALNRRGSTKKLYTGDH